MQVRRVFVLCGIMVLVMIQLPVYGATVASVQQDVLDKVEPQVLEELENSGWTDFFVWMVEKADLSPAYQLQTKLEKGRFVYKTLRATAERTQASLWVYLNVQGADYQSFYIANKILVRGGDRQLLMHIAARPNVARITANHQFQLEEPLDWRPAPSHVQAIEPNIIFVKAPQAWAMGITGEGAVVSGMDTGIEATHPVIAPHYRGCLNPPLCSTWEHDYNWWDATDTYPIRPGDGHGHGTYTSGLMVGDDGGNNQIGVAPGARLIHCKALRDSGNTSAAALIECFQWNLAPWDLSGQNPRPDLAPDALNNSWGFWGGGQNQYRDEILALHAAGIVVGFSSGNEGPACQTLRSPGDYWQVLTTGSVSHTVPYPGSISDLSSRGPSDLDPSPPYWFPDVIAPGEDIRSSVPGGGYTYGSGTSASVPHATALVALCWTAAPSLRGQVTETIRIITSTAAPLTGQGGSNCGGDYTTGPNNDWGYGTIDALATVQACMDAEPPDFSLTLLPDQHSVCRPGIVTSTVLVGSWGNYNQPVTLTDPGVPAGINTDFTMNPVTPLPGESVYWITVTDSVADGSHTWLLLGNSPTRTHAVTVTVVVNSEVPVSPTLLSPPDGAVGLSPASIPFRWSPVPEATWYHLQVDDDPVFSSPSVDVTGIPTAGYTLTDFLTPTTAYYWRVSAGGGCGEGEYSTAFTFTVRDACILLVDDDQDAPDVRTYYTEALDYLGLTYDIWNIASQGEPQAHDLTGYPLLFWFTGFPRDNTFIPHNEEAASIYLDGGGNLFLSSEDYLHEYFLTLFGRDYLGIYSFSSDAGGTDPIGNPGDPIGNGLGPYVMVPPPGWGAFYTDYVNAIQASPFRWLGSGQHNSVHYDGGAFKTVFLGWPLEGLAGLDERSEVLEAVYHWFGGCGCESVHDADFSWDPLIPTVGLAVTLTADASGTLPITYSWELEIGRLGEGQVITHSYSLPGEYRVVLTATNCTTATTTAVHTITVLPEPCEPVHDVDFAWAPPTSTIDQVVTFTGTATGTLPIIYSWEFEPGRLGEGQVVTHSYGLPGEYRVVMTATNCATAGAVHTITVTCDKVEILTVTTDISGCVVTFGAGLSGVAPYTYSWDFGALGTSTETNPLVDFGATGDYTGTLTVWNCGGGGSDVFPFAVEVACASIEWRIYLPVVFKSGP